MTMIDLTGYVRAAGMPPMPQVIVPEVVIRKMPWKCLDCHNKWIDRADCKGVVERGCPKCGSHRMFDCNVEFVGWL